MLSARVPLSCRAPLPSLPPLESEPEPALPYIIRALETTSLTEKNNFLMKTISIWKESRALLMQAKRENMEKKAILQHFETLTENRKNELRKYLEATEFYRKPSLVRRHKDKNYFIESIKEAEQLMSKYTKVNSPALLDSLLESDLSNTDMSFKLYDLLFKRWEEAAYTYTNRLNKIQDSIETQNSLKEEFGGSSKLFDTYNELVTENKQMLDEEAQMIHDAFIKRRKTKDISLYATRTIISLLQEMINEENTALDEFAKQTFDARPPAAKISIDDVIKKEPFSSKELNFNNNENENEELSLNEQLIALNKSIKEVNDTNKELEDQIKSVNVSQLHIEGLIKYQKFIEDNISYNKKLNELRDSVNTNTSQISSLYYKIKSIMKEKNSIECSYAQNVTEMNKLIAAQATIMPMMERNKASINTLCSVTSEFGNTLLHGKDDVSQMFDEKIQKLAKENVTEKSRSSVKSVKEPTNIHLKHFKRKMQRMSLAASIIKPLLPVGDSSLNTTKSSDTDALKTKPVVKEPKVNHERTFTKPELILALSTTLELADVASNRAELHTQSSNIIDVLHNGIKQEINKYNQELCGMINNTRMLSNSILVKEKCDAGVQNSSLYVDFSLQTDPEVTPPKDAKGKKKK